jgi:hypothetical protein
LRNAKIFYEEKIEKAKTNMKGTWKILNEFVNRKKNIQKASASWPEITDTSRIRQRTFSM